MAKNISKKDEYIIDKASTFEIIKLDENFINPKLAIDFKGFCVCKYYEEKGLIIQEQIAKNLQQLSNDYCLPVLTKDKFFSPKKPIDYYYFDTTKLEKKQKSTSRRQDKSLRDLELLINEKKRAKQVYLELRKGNGFVELLVEDLSIRKEVVESYLLKLEKQGFIKDIEGFYSVLPQRDSVLKFIYEWK